MASSSPSDDQFITFYDLSSIFKPESWSPNTGKIRFLLNYLKIEYDLKFLTYPEVEPTLKSLGVPPWPKDANGVKCAYSVPAITIGSHHDKQETVMGGEYQIIDKLSDLFGSKFHEKVYDGDEEFVKLFGIYALQLNLRMFSIVAPFIYNILDDDQDKDFYQTTRLSAGRGDMLSLQKTPQVEILSKWEALHDEIVTFKSFAQILRDNGVDDDKIKSYELYLTRFKNGDSKYIHGNVPCFADFRIYAILKWGFMAIKGGCVEYDILGNGVLKEWYLHMSEYDA